MNKIDFFFEDIEPLSINFDKVNDKVNYLIINELKEIGDLSIIFCSDAYLLNINKQYLNHNYYTDIITFDYVEKNIISGDLFISISRIEENAKTYETKLIEELYRVIFHGILHLIGYNDKTDEEQRIMTEKENFYLKKVDFRETKL